MAGHGWLLEAVPNVSEGRDETTLARLAAAAVSGGAYLADVHTDGDHHRSVFTLMGSGDQLHDGLVALAGAARERIDLAGHDGVHPRVGVVDVMPIVALDAHHPAGADEPAACDLAERLELALSSEGHDVLGYGPHIAERPFAGAARAGILGGADAVAASGGGTILVGQRPVLIALNVMLEGTDLGVARQVAREIRESDGGIEGVRALGFALSSRACAQVSMNLERWQDASPRRVVDEVRARVEAAGGRATAVELVGLAPAAALEELAGCGLEILAAAEPTIEAHAARATGACLPGGRVQGSTLDDHDLT